jgi:hypothetical protein
MTNRKMQYWVIPPEKDGEFVACMEDVLDVYHMPYNAQIPVLCMDEQPIQLLKDVRQTIPATHRHPRRVDYEYERNGTASIFMVAEPLKGWRNVTVRPQRTKIEWAQEIAEIINTKYADAEKVILICDNLNTHTLGAFYSAFDANTARQLVKRIEIHHTPKHGSWLNIAENELSVMTRQSIKNKRFSTIEELAEQLSAWSKCSNENQRGVDWQFTVNDARIKLKSLYPNL